MRQKTVFKKSMVAHVWAQQSQQNGRNAQGNFYFEGPTIFSYGSHFPIAKFITNKRGERAVLFTRREYSPTTSRHKTEVRCALPSDTPVIHVDDLRGLYWLGEISKDELKAIHEANRKHIADVLVLAARARKAYRRIWHIEAARIRAAEDAAFLKFFGLRWKPLAVPEDVEAELPALLERREREQAEEAERLKQRYEKQERERAERARIAALEAEERQKLWLAGEQVRLQYNDFRGESFARLRIFGDKVETSKGADVPVDHAKRLWPIIQRVIASGKPYVRNGHSEHVGHFTVDQIFENGDMRVGCHLIPYAEIEKIAGQLGLLEHEAA